MYSLEHAFAITGDAVLADRIERVAYNALPAAFTDDMWAHQLRVANHLVSHCEWVKQTRFANWLSLHFAAGALK